jgi:ferredoxin
MSTKVHPNLMKELTHFGLKDASQCYHCGNCTGVCPLSTADNPFPRRFMRMVQLGQIDKIREAPEPWLCYYCGECSDYCPRGADPGEAMMVMRRYLTSLYDWTGFARRFYTSEVFEVAAVSVVAAIVGVLFLIFGQWSEALAKPGIALNTFAPNTVIEILDLIMAAVLTFFLLSNVWRCVKITQGVMHGKIPFKYYKDKFVELVWNFISQWQFSKCEDKKQWVVHLLIMTGYSSVFLMVVVGLRWFQRDSVIDPEWPIVTAIMTLVGYYATFAIMYGTTYALIGRIRKTKAPYKNSHGTDWMFLILLQLTTITGILVHAFIYLEWPMSTYVIYVIHLMVAVPMLVLEVPFAKWAHLAYRPVVLFLNKVKLAYWEDHPEQRPSHEPLAEAPQAAQAEEQAEAEAQPA